MALIKFKKPHKKIAMGLLSFMPNEQHLDSLQKTMQQYENNPNWQLYLWQQADDFIGAIGIELNELTFNVHHACVNPSFRNEGIGRSMVEEVQELHQPLALCATPETKDFLEKCWNRQFS